MGRNEIQTIHIISASLLSVSGDQSSWRFTLRHSDSRTLGTTSIRAKIKLDGDIVDNVLGGYITYNGEVGDTTVHDITFDACLPTEMETYDYTLEWYSSSQSWIDAIYKSAFHRFFQECANK